MAFHLKNLKIQKDKFFSSLTYQQLCEIANDGEIMHYINQIPIRRDEIATIFAGIGDSCDTRKVMPTGVRQKKLAALVTQLSKIIKEYEVKKVQLAANLANTQRKQKEAANAAAAAQAEANRKAAENQKREANLRMAEEAAKAAKNAANAQLKNAEAAATVAVANASLQATNQETVALRNELFKIRNSLNNLRENVNAIIGKTLKGKTNSAPAARRASRRMTRKSNRK